MKMGQSSPKGRKKGEIARFSTVFQKTCTADTLEPGLLWERVKNNSSKQNSNRLNFKSRHQYK